MALSTTAKQVSEITKEEALKKLEAIMSRNIKEPLWFSDVEPEGQYYTVTLFQEISNGSTRRLIDFYIDRLTSEIFSNQWGAGEKERINSFKVPDSFMTYPNGVYLPEDVSEKSLCSFKETLLFSFETKNHKTTSFCVSKAEPHYYVYKYGAKGKIELEFPKDKKNTKKMFKVEYYSKYQGDVQEDYDLSYLSFHSGYFTYKIYWEYRITSGKDEIGIRVINKANGKVTDIKGDPDSIIGNLSGLRFTDLNQGT